MKHTRLLTLLVLLMTAAMDAWAQSATPVKHLIKGFNARLSAMEQTLPYETTVFDFLKFVNGTTYITSSVSLSEVTSSNPSVVSVGTFAGWNTPISFKADGDANITMSGEDSYGELWITIAISVLAPKYVYMANGTTDTDRWTVKVGNGSFGMLPIGGLTGDGTETITLKYSGTRQVKSITATVVE